MLIDLESNNLNRLRQRYSFDHLKPSPAVFSITIPEEEIFMHNLSEQKKRRKIFYNVHYQPQQTAKIEEIKILMEMENITDHINDELILKHIYTSKWNNQKTIQRIKQVIAYNKNQVVVRLDQQTIKRLGEGSIYTYGYDKKMLPLLVMRIDKINFKQPLEQILNTVYYLMLVVKAYKMVPYHAEKFVLIIDFNDISFTSIPYIHIYDIIHKMATYYCGLTQRTFLCNSTGISKIWKLVYGFLPEYQKKKLIFIHKGEEKKLLEWVDELQLERRYGGKLANLQTFWPPKQTNEDISIASDSASYYSVENDYEFFDPSQDTASSCGKNCSCDIY